MKCPVGGEWFFCSKPQRGSHPDVLSRTVRLARSFAQPSLALHHPPPRTPLLEPPHDRPRCRLSRCCCCVPPPQAVRPLNYCVSPAHLNPPARPPTSHLLGCSAPGAHTKSFHAPAPPPCADPSHHHPLSAPLCCGSTIVGNFYQPVASSGASIIALSWVPP